MAEVEESPKMDIEKDEKSLDLSKCAGDFSKYCQVDITDETRGLEESIEEMLANLDEFSHLADTVPVDIAKMSRCPINVLIGGRAAIQGSDVRVALLTPELQHYVTALYRDGAIFGNCSLLVERKTYLIRNDSSQILFVLLPELCEKCQALPTIFNQIDQLEVFMEKVKKCVDEFEENVCKAEEELGSHSIKKVLNAIPYLNLMQKKQIPPPKPPEAEAAPWQSPELFKTSDFFQKDVNEKSLDSEGITMKLETSFETAEPD